MNRLLALTWKEFLQLRRDHMTLRLIVLVPLMQTLIFGYAINYDVKDLKTIVLDESRSYESRELVAKMAATGYFEIVGHVGSLAEMQAEIDSARAMVGVVIDRDFGKDRHRGAPARALLVVNASDTTTSSFVRIAATVPGVRTSSPTGVTTFGGGNAPKLMCTI